MFVDSVFLFVFLFFLFWGVNPGSAPGLCSPPIATLQGRDGWRKGARMVAPGQKRSYPCSFWREKIPRIHQPTKGPSISPLNMLCPCPTSFRQIRTFFRWMMSRPEATYSFSMPDGVLINNDTMTLLKMMTRFPLQ